ncbi:MBOAT family O-acyltransferase [Paenibacillus sp. LHD-117]|uniref:MBOAT family O-acyltransferase n=1 Tax=Paenibacillus sp. LHD-117 TaxID=3071412 RepID=UPI0027E1F76A|nr:MBOAT family O-acyltransferase [Paenibacillus sp. LHD-117]MDQ6419747.1 MBOAT family O-acyltransferase [Paenibacillus sp. LHD-117]
MLFNSPTFLLFLIAVFTLYYLFPRGRMLVLAIANAAFYAYAGVGYFLLFGVIVAAVYGISKFLGGRNGKLALVAGLVVVLGNLVFFKYSMFLLENIERMLGFTLSLQGTAFDDRMIALPIGISFYSFQLIAYLVDVYKGKLKPSRSLFEFWVFISLFAHSAAGPILRGGDFLPQLRNIASIHFRTPRVKLGLAFILLGLVKKVVIVEKIAPYVNEYFNNAQTLNGVESWVASYLFAFQIYFDFSAYSEMAVGIGFLLGLRLDLNFKTPYLSGSSTEFWRRWHITLSQWIRDYVFIPLGGSRVKNWRIYVNLIAAMTISGIWHGAAWTFIIWGFYHGLLSAAHRMYGKGIKKLGWQKLQRNWLYKVLAIAVFFHLTVIGWVFFRANSWADAVHMLKQMTLLGGVTFTKETLMLLAVAAGLYLLHIVESVAVKHFKRWSLAWEMTVPSIVRGAVYAAIAIGLLMLLMNGEASTFIYFAF